MVMACDRGFGLQYHSITLDVEKSRRCEMCFSSCPIAMKFDRRLDSSAVEAPVKFHGDRIKSILNLTASEHHVDLTVKRLRLVNTGFEAKITHRAIVTMHRSRFCMTFCWYHKPIYRVTEA